MTQISDSNPTVVTLADLRQALELERAELLSSVQGHDDSRRSERSDVTSGSGETEHLVVAEQESTTALVDTMMRTTLNEIDAALARFDDNTYGNCIGCEASIPLERLEAMPAAAYCVSCQQGRESTAF